MKPPNQHSRVNLAELKGQIVKKLGPEGSKQYFYYLQKFLSLKISKVEFDKLCIRILGRENIPLHNHFVRSILRNACGAKAPPSASHKDIVFKHCTEVSGKEISADGSRPNGSISMAQVSVASGLANGSDMFPVSPRKARTGFRDRRSGECRSVLGAHGKSNVAPQLSSASQASEFNVVLDNGDINSPLTGRQLQHHEGPTLQAENNSAVLRKDVSALVNSKDQTDVTNHRKDASARSPVRAPLGVPFCPVSIGGARRALPPPSSIPCVCTSTEGTLLDSFTLRERMEHIALALGLEGASADCANILNHGLDSYLKILIRSCIELVGARSGHELTKNNNHKHHINTKLINGVRPDYRIQMQNSGKHLEMQEQKIHCPISLKDFRVAMELNPRQLGEDWPLLLEKIYTESFEE